MKNNKWNKADNFKKWDIGVGPTPKPASEKELDAIRYSAAIPPKTATPPTNTSASSTLPQGHENIGPHDVTTVVLEVLRQRIAESHEAKSRNAASEGTVAKQPETVPIS